jgi:heme/copper-type cytochrome/quinol oxidase subunit 2
MNHLAHMKTARQHLSELEVTAWVLIAIFLAALLVFSYLFWKRLAPEFPQASESRYVIQITSDPPPAIPVSSASEVVEG